MAMLRYTFDLAVVSINDFAFGMCFALPQDEYYDCNLISLQFVRTYGRGKRVLPRTIVCLHLYEYVGSQMVHYLTQVAEALVEPIAILICSLHPEMVVYTMRNPATPGVCQMYFFMLSEDGQFQTREDYTNFDVYFNTMMADDLPPTGESTSITTLSYELGDSDTERFHTLRWVHCLRWLFLWFREYKKPHPLDKKDLISNICSFL